MTRHFVGLFFQPTADRLDLIAIVLDRRQCEIAVLIFIIRRINREMTIYILLANCLYLSIDLFFNRCFHAELLFLPACLLINC